MTHTAATFLRLLSVSAIGSSSLQLHRDHLRIRLDHRFQYPQSDRVVCNRDSVSSPCSMSIFQYPQSDRVVCNYYLKIIRAGYVTFQYPQSDRVVCNIDTVRPPNPLPFLSVSAIGSSSLQLYLAANGTLITLSFSIRNRIE